jgi:Holliday junction DNA helicase RuvA
MIGRLQGKIAYRSIDKVLLDINGVGYDVSVSLSTLNALPDDPESDAILHIHTHVREDTLQLMGFHSLEERELFRMLIGVSGIGPRLGLTVLSHITPAEFADTVQRENLKRLTAIPGIGKRTAERVILELREKVVEMALGLAPSEAQQVHETKGILRDLQSALVNFGYRAAAVEKVVAELESEAQAGIDLQELVVLGLKKLTK